MDTNFKSAKLNNSFENYRSKAIICFFMALICVFCLFAAFLYLDNNDTIVYGNTKILKDWQYAVGSNMPELNNSNVEYKQINSLSNIITSIDKNYIRLNKILEASNDTQYLYVNTYFNQVLIKINHGKIIDSIDETVQLGSKLYYQLEISPSENETTIDIIIRASFVPKITSYISKQQNATVPLSITGILNIIFIIAVSILSIISVSTGILSKNIRVKSRLMPIGYSGIIFCIYSILLGAFFYNNLNNFLLLKITISIAMLAGVMLFYAAIKITGLSSGFLYGLVSVGILYLTVFLITTHDLLLYVLAKYYGLYILIAFMILVILLLKKLPKEENGWVYLFPIFLVSLSYISYCMVFSLNRGYMITLIVMFTFTLYSIISLVQAYHLKRKEIKIKEKDFVDDTWLMLYKPTDIGNIDKLLDIFLQNKSNMTHVRNVSHYVYAICYQSGMPKEQAEMVAKASFLHDIGKIMVPQKTLNKEGTLSTEEYEQMKMHAQHGYDILSSSKNEFLQTAALIAKQHHERYDGNGYFGLKGEDIHIYSQIACIADVFEAITAERDYKKAWSFEDGFNYIANHGGIYFSPVYVDAFIKCKDDIHWIYENIKNK